MMTVGSTMLLGGLAASAGAIAAGSAAGLLASTVVAGAGFGSAFLGAFRTLASRADPQHRGGLLAAVFTAAYLSFSVPAVVAGFVAARAGLRPTALGYATALAVLAVVALLLRLTSGRAGTTARAARRPQV